MSTSGSHILETLRELDLVSQGNRIGCLNGVSIGDRVRERDTELDDVGSTGFESEEGRDGGGRGWVSGSDEGDKGTVGERKQRFWKGNDGKR